MKYIILFSLVLLPVICVSGQEQYVDSLINRLNTEKLTTDKELELYLRICIRYGSSNQYEKVIDYGKKGLKIARKEKFKCMASDFSECIGIAYYSTGDYEKSYPYLKDALDLAMQADCKENEVSVHLSIGAYYGRLGKYTEALEHFIAALSVSENLGNKKQSIRILGNIGGIYNTLNNPDRAAHYFEQAITLANEADMPVEKIKPYYELARYYINKKEIRQALDYSLKTVELSRTYNSITFEALGLRLLATIYSLSEEYDKALGYINESIPLSEKTNDPIMLAGAFKQLSDIYLKQSRYKECEEIAYKSWQLDSTDLAMKPDLLFNIAYANLFMGNQKKSATYFRRYGEEMREQSNKNFQEILAGMDVKYETEKKEMHIASLEKERQLYIWLGIAGILLAIAFGIVLWQKIRSAHKERQLVASNAVQEGEMGERVRIAGELHDRLLGTLSSVKAELNNADIIGKLDGCIEEIRRITHNLMPISLRFGIKPALEDFTAQFPNVYFHFFGQEKRIEKRVEFALYCCANELVTNSVRHSGAKNINVQLVQDEGYVSLTVQDDGCGFDEAFAVKGIGLKNIRDRVASCDGKIAVFSSPDKGTETIIELKNGKDR